MNSKEYFEYIYETNIIENLAKQEFGIVKNAGLFQDLNLPGVADSIKNFVKEHVNPNGPGGYVGSILNLMAPSILFRAHPIVGILYLVASQFGFDMQGIISKISEALRPKLESGQPVTASEVSDIGKQVIASVAGENVTAAPKNLFESIQKNAALYKYSAGSSTPETPFLFGGDGGLIQRIFGQLFSMPRGKSKATWLLGGFIIWIIKTVLVGAGLIAGAEAISGMLGHKKPEQTDKQETVQEHQPEKTVEEEKPQTAFYQTTTDAAKSNSLWVVPIIDGNLEKTLMSWTKEFYPDKFSNTNFENTLKHSYSWNNIMDELSDPKKMSKKYLVMPEHYSSRKQIVDAAIKDV